MALSRLCLSLGLGGGTSATSSGAAASSGTERLENGDFSTFTPVAMDQNAVGRKTLALTAFSLADGLGVANTGSQNALFTISQIFSSPSNNYPIRIIEDFSTAYVRVNVSGYPWAANFSPSLTGAYVYDSATSKYVCSGVGTLEFAGVPADWGLYDNGQAGLGAGYRIDHFTDQRALPHGTMQNGVSCLHWTGRHTHVTETVSNSAKLRGSAWEVADAAPDEWSLAGGYTDYASLVAGSGLRKIGNVPGPELKQQFSTPLPAGRYNFELTRGDATAGRVNVYAYDTGGNLMSVVWMGGHSAGQGTTNSYAVGQSGSFVSSAPVGAFGVGLLIDGLILEGVSLTG